LISYFSEIRALQFFTKRDRDVEREVRVIKNRNLVMRHYRIFVDL
jgi:hypothetical protein